MDNVQPSSLTTFVLTVLTTLPLPPSPEVNDDRSETVLLFSPSCKEIQKEDDFIID